MDLLGLAKIAGADALTQVGMIAWLARGHRARGLARFFSSIIGSDVYSLAAVVFPLRLAGWTPFSA